MEVNIHQLAQEMPDFHSHDAARNWFEQKYPDSFLYKSHDVSEGLQVFYYHIVKNEQDYQQFMASLAEQSDDKLVSDAPFHTYTTVEIAENGDVSLSI